MHTNIRTIVVVAVACFAGACGSADNSTDTSGQAQIRNVAEIRALLSEKEREETVISPNAIHDGYITVSMNDGQPQIDNDRDTVPLMLYFAKPAKREGEAAFQDACYSGPEEDVRKLLKALVDVQSSIDFDYPTEILSMNKNAADGVIKVQFKVKYELDIVTYLTSFRPCTPN